MVHALRQAVPSRWLVLLAAFGLLTSGVTSLAAPADAQTSTVFRWTFDDSVPQEARDAMQNEVGPRWEALITSAVPIDISVSWVPQGPGGLAAAGAAWWTTTNAGPVQGVDYPIALVEALEGVDRDADAAAEITIEVNSEQTWDYSVGTTAPGKVDFIGTLIHEVAHGLGFSGGLTRRSDGTGHYFGTPTIFDYYVEDGSGQRIVDTYPEDSTALGDALVSDDLFWAGAAAVAGAGGSDCGSDRNSACPAKPKLYAPTTWEGGSSVSHWDEATYQANSENAMMTPTAIGNETSQEIGPMTVGLIRDIGWPEPGATPDPTQTPTEEPTTEPTGEPTTEPTESPTTGTGRAGGWDGDPATTERIGTNGAPATAIRISQARFEDDFDALWVVLSRDDVFADSLSGTPLTRYGPLLLTPTGGLSADVRAEIDRVLIPGDPVYLLGGPAALSPAIADELTAAGYNVVRLSGRNRFETSLAIADEVRRVFGDTQQAIVARAFGTDTNPTAAWADSVTAGAYAAHYVSPVLLSPTEGLTPEVESWLNADSPSVSWVLGGTAALSDRVPEQAVNPVRVFGTDRAATASAIAERMWGVDLGTGTWAIIDGFGTNGWAFGLAAAGLAADAGAPLLPVQSTGVPGPTAAALSACGAPQVDLLVVGGSGIIADSVVADLDARDGGAC